MTASTSILQRANVHPFRRANRYVACLALLLASLAAAPAVRAADADKGPASPTPEISEAQRKAYADAMRDARALVAQKKYDDAIAKLDSLAAERPREPQARFLKAIVLADQKKNDEAITAYRALVADFPEMPEPHNNLAVLYAQKGDLTLARDELLLAIVTAPDYALAHENLGDVYVKLAAEQYERAAALDKRNKAIPVKLKTVRDAIQAVP